MHCGSHDLRISTHALTEGDQDVRILEMRRYISTHALTEGDTTLKLIYFRVVIFQLTPSRRATANLDKFFF